LCIGVEKKLNDFSGHRRILMKVLGPVKLCSSNFGAGVSDQPASRAQAWAKTSLLL